MLSLLPSRCTNCGAAGRSPCAKCQAELVVPPPAGDGIRSALYYEGVARELVARLKYRNHRDALWFLAGLVAALVDRAEIDVVTWVPTTARHRRERGFDHGEMLARAVAKRLRRPARRLLTRPFDDPQTGRNKAQRAIGPTLHARPAASGRRVLIVDDVTTTGVTLANAACQLERAGAVDVVKATAGRTPLGHHGVGNSGNNLSIAGNAQVLVVR